MTDVYALVGPRTHEVFLFHSREDALEAQKDYRKHTDGSFVTHVSTYWK